MRAVSDRPATTSTSCFADKQAARPTTSEGLWQPPAVVQQISTYKQLRSAKSTIWKWQSWQEACAAKLGPCDTQVVELLARDPGNHCVRIPSYLRCRRHALPTSFDIDIALRKQRSARPTLSETLWQPSAGTAAEICI